MVLLFVVAWPLSKLLDCLLGHEHSTFFRRAGKSQCSAVISFVFSLMLLWKLIKATKEACNPNLQVAINMYMYTWLAHTWSQLRLDFP